MSDTKTSFDNSGKAIADGWATVYGYDYMGVFTAAYPVQLNKGMGIPAKTTLIQPPVAVTGSVAVYNADTGVWRNQIDHRGVTVYDKATLTASVIDYLGDYRSGVTPQKPPSSYYTWNETTGTWVLESALSLAQQKAEVLKSVTAELARAVQMISICEDKLQLAYFSTGETKDSVTATELLWKKYRLQCIDYINGVLTVVPDAPDSSAYAAAVKAAADEAAKEEAAKEAAELEEEREEEEKEAAANSAATATATADTTGTDSTTTTETTATAPEDSATDTTVTTSDKTDTKTATTGTDSDTTTGKTDTTTGDTGTTETTSTETTSTETTSTTGTSEEETKS